MPGSSIPLRVDTASLIFTGSDLTLMLPRENLLRLHHVEQIPATCMWASAATLSARVFKHKNKWFEDSFTARYSFDLLVCVDLSRPAVDQWQNCLQIAVALMIAPPQLSS
jgi:hypothetical protein